MLRVLAWQSLRSRKKTVILTFLSLVVSISVMLMVEHLRAQAKDSFKRSISGTDLIVGAPSGDLNLLLYSVFRMGNPTSNIQFDSYKMLSEHDSVAWSIPISLGDSHRGYRVLGTTEDYFKYFTYGDKRQLKFNHGSKFEKIFDVVLGSDVAQSLKYKTGDKIVISHGIGSTSFQNHEHAPFSIKGILEPTGTPVDKTVHVSLAAIEAIHLPPSQLTDLDAHQRLEPIVPSSITAVLIGLENKFATFALQRHINSFQNDRLMAVLPGVAMTQLWQLMGNIENLLRFIALLVLLSSLFGLATMLIASMNERGIEIAVLRTLGASPGTLFQLIVYEALLIASIAFVAAYILVSVLLILLSEWLVQNYGLFLSVHIFSVDILFLGLLILVSVLLAAFMPAIEAYRRGLQAQLSS
jgi:putative ABC transport system permease protein